MQWGAYGYRLRRHFARDQLDIAVDLLKANPNDRRVVLQMWDIHSDLDVSSKDIPCNNLIYPRIVSGKLDITVCCRSNDMIWGAYGANLVHFSIIQEYLAGRIGVGVGTYYQVSNNFHAYEDVFQKLSARMRGGVAGTTNEYFDHPAMPIGTNWEEWDNDLENFMNVPFDSDYTNMWFHHTALPIYTAALCHREKRPDKAMSSATEILDPHWRKACVEWLERRNQNAEK